VIFKKEMGAVMFPFPFSHFFVPHLSQFLMPKKIGFLLPRSGEYPSMGFDLNDAFRLGLQELGQSEIQVLTENIGFGEDLDLTHSKCEKFVLNEDVDLIVAYSTSLNAEALYGFAQACGKPFLFLDAGMEIFEAPPSPFCRHLTLQGAHGCFISGKQTSEAGNFVIAATSFYDGGYRGPFYIVKGIEEVGGSVCGNYVSVHKPEEFSIEILLQLLQHSGGNSVSACFSSYLTELFMKKLKENPNAAKQLPFYCTPFMAEEFWLEKIDFPEGTFHTVVPWATSLENAQQQKMTDSLLKNKNKKPTIFHLLGWEAAQVAQQILQNGINAVNDWSFESPRGTVTFHPETNCAYAPLYRGKIESGENGKCKLNIGEKITVNADDHKKIFFTRPEGSYTRWRNNYLSI
jgi:branched-chain amino acid transport system substrate-binding protein